MTAAVRVKFCGLTRAADVEASVRLGADYLGFVFVAGSRRGLDPQGGARLLGGVDTGAARRVGVFRDQPAAFVNDVVARCRLDLVQLHGHEPPDFATALAVPAIRVVRVPVAGAHGDAEPGAQSPPAADAYALLVDAEDATGASGGLGRRPDRERLAACLAALPAGVRVFLSGGLTPDNVAAAVARHRPYAVDVASGIESAPGIKDAARMAAFVAALGGRT